MSRSSVPTQNGHSVEKKAYFFTILLLLSTCCGKLLASPCNISQSAMAYASDIRGLKSKQKVPCHRHSKEQVRKHLRHLIETKVTAARVKGEELCFKTLGIIPEDFDYLQGVLDLYLSQIGGYYDPEKDHYVMADWLPDAMQLGIAVHELTHALQDQYYDLDRFMDINQLSNDELLAHSALVEGDASAVMTDYARKLQGQESISRDQDVEALLVQTVLGTTLISQQSKIPKSLVSLMLFPYTSGLRFAHALLKSGGYKKFDQAFKNPPASTEEILHPEIYFAKEKSFKSIQIAEVVNNPDSEVIYSDVLGEFTIAVMFEALGFKGMEASDIAAGWAGDRVVIFKDKEGAKFLHWRLFWDSQKEARQFTEALVKLKVKHPTAKINRDSLKVDLKIGLN